MVKTHGQEANKGEYDNKRRPSALKDTSASKSSRSSKAKAKRKRTTKKSAPKSKKDSEVPTFDPGCSVSDLQTMQSFTDQLQAFFNNVRRLFRSHKNFPQIMNQIVRAVNNWIESDGNPQAEILKTSQSSAGQLHQK